MIVSSIPGRLRVKVPQAQPEQLAVLRDAISGFDSVSTVRLNLAARSLIVTYEVVIPAATMEQKVIQKLEHVCCADSRPAPPHSPSHSYVHANPVHINRVRKSSMRRQVNRWAKRLAIVSLPLSIGLVYAGNKKLHVLTGWFFVAALATHVVIHRNNTFR